MSTQKPEKNFVEQPITATLEENYMPYAMSVIISRAIPEIDGFKPSHRKLLYTMYKMGLLSGARTKSANVVGQTMKLNPHGDAAIYETMVRLTQGNQALLHPYVDSKGNFGKQYSRDMAYAAARYTEVKLDSLCSELFRGIDSDMVDFVPNYDNQTTEPLLLPTSFPNILVNVNQGIAVGMASSICSFNLADVCETTIALINNPEHDISQTLPAPDFSTGGELIYNNAQLESIYQTGRGSISLRAVYSYDPKQHCIEITEIPYTASIESIIEKVVDLVKQGKLREISDIRDETALSGLKIAIDLKRGVDPDILMQKLYKLTPLQDSFGCNFNVLVEGTPRVLGIRELLSEWIAFRVECVKRRIHFDIQRKSDKLHLLIGLSKILLDIDKAIRIIRDTDDEDEVIPNLMVGFMIDEPQAEYIAEIRLRNLNKQYILNRVNETNNLKDEIARLKELLSNRAGINALIASELAGVSKKYRQPRRTRVVYENEIEQYNEENYIDDYPVNLFLTRGGYFKKITAQSLRMSSEQRLKENDSVLMSLVSTNKSEIIFFTDKYNAYKARLHEFDDTKASAMGDYLNTKLSMESDENILFMAATDDYSGYLMLFFEDGRAAKIKMSCYATKSNRKKLTGAYCDKIKLVRAFFTAQDCDYVTLSSSGKALVLNSVSIPEKTTRTTQGVMAMTQRKGHHVTHVYALSDINFADPGYYRTRNLPAVGNLLREEDNPNRQMKLGE